MSELKEYEYHELSEEYDLIEDEEFDEFVADIEKNGLLEPIVLYEGKILDGRNRYRACQKLGIPGKYRNFPKGKSAKNFVRSENYHRRHLNIAQRAELGLKWKKELAEEIKREESLRKKGISQKKESPKHASKIAANKAKIGKETIRKYEKIKEIADKDSKLKDEWNKAKKGETSIEAVYNIAQVIDSMSMLSAPYKHKIRAELESKDKSIKQIKIEIQDKKDDLKRSEIASRDRALEKKNEELDKLHFKISKLKDSVSELIGACKQSKIILKIYSKEAFEKYPNIKSNDSDRVVQYLGEYYDTLDVKLFDKQLKEIKAKYDELEKPLRDKLLILESERKIKKDTINKQKADTSKESVWIEKQLEIMLAEYDKQELYKEDIIKDKKELTELQDKYDGE